MSSIIILVPPPFPDDGGRVAKPRVQVTIEYDPPEHLSEKQIARVRKALQREAEKIVAKYG